MSKSKRAATEESMPTREQPRRAVKRDTPLSVEDLGEGKMPELEPVPDWDYFDKTNEEDGQRAAAVQSLGGERRALSDEAYGVKAGAKRATESQLLAVPKSMSFGPSAGCGAGFYEENCNVHRVGFGTAGWLATKEIAPEKSRKNGRDGEVYETPVELICGKLDSQHTRANSKVKVMYLVNGTMIKAYGMYNKEVKSIPEHYLDAKLWWRCPEWTEWVEHTAISQYFMPVPYRSASEPAWLAHDQDRLVVVGTLFTEKLTIYHYLCWSGIDTMFLTSPDADCALQPSFAWNAYKDWRSEPEAIIRALLVKNSRGEIVIMPEEDRGRQTSYRFLPPHKLLPSNDLRGDTGEVRCSGRTDCH